MRRFTVDHVMLCAVVMTLFAHYVVSYLSGVQRHEKERLWRAVVCITDQSTPPKLSAVLWMQAGASEADVVQIPANALVGEETEEHTPTLASLYRTSHFLATLRRFVRYALGLPVERVVQCSLEELLDHAVGDDNVSIVLPNDMLVVFEHRSIFYGRGKHLLDRSRLRELWSGYSFWGGEWGRLQRQRVILQTILRNTASSEHKPESLLWLAHLQRRKVHYLSVPGTRRNKWVGSDYDAVQVTPTSFNTIARQLREKDRRSDVRVHLCFSPKVPPVTQQRTIEELLDKGFSVTVAEQASGCAKGNIRATENLPEDLEQVLAVIRGHARWSSYCQEGKEVHVVVR